MSRAPSKWLRSRATALLSVMMLAGGASLVASTAPSSAATSSKTPASKCTIGYANGWIGNTWRAQQNADEQIAANYYVKHGMIGKVITANSPNNLSQQINQVNGFISEHVCALLIDPVSQAAVESILPRAQAAHILVVIANDPAPTPGVLNVVGDNYTWWKIQAQWIAKKLKGKGNIVEITGVPGNTADVLRQQAAQAVLAKYPNIHVVAKAPGSWSEATAQTAMSTILASHPKIDGLLLQDVMAAGVIRAFQAAKVPLPKIMTGDYIRSFFQWWAANPSQQVMAVPYSPAHVADALGFEVRLLNGKKLRPGVQVGNPLNSKVKDAIMIPNPQVVTNTGEQGPWCNKFTECISLAKALQLLKGKPATYALDQMMTQEQIDSYFK